MSGKRIETLWKVYILMVMTLLFSITFITSAQTSPFVSSIRWSPDGSIIALGFSSSLAGPACAYDVDYDIDLFNVTTGQNVTTLEQDYCSIVSMDFSNSGDFLFTATRTGVRTIWNLTTLAPEFSSQIFAIVLEAKPNNKDTAILVIYSHGIEIVDPQTFQPIYPSRRAADLLTNITDATWSPDGSMIAIGDETGQVHLWNIGANTIDGVFNQHTRAITSIDWNPTRNIIASADASGNLHIWDATTLQMLSVSTGQMQPISELVWRPDGNELAAVAIDGTTSIFSSVNDTWAVATSYPGTATALDYSPSGGRIVVGQQIAANQAQSLSTGNLPFDILVPLPTAERFAEIAAFCNAPASLTAIAEDAWLMTQSDESQGRALLAQLDRLAEGAIPVGCEADLRAIAEAMQMQGEP